MVRPETFCDCDWGKAENLKAQWTEQKKQKLNDKNEKQQKTYYFNE